MRQWRGVLYGCLVMMTSSAATGQTPLTPAQRASDLVFLDSLLLRALSPQVSNLEGLASRDALVRLSQDTGLTSSEDWALAVHRWLRASGDAHLRVCFESVDAFVQESVMPAAEALLDPDGCWAGYGPGMGLPESARLAWAERTWSLLPSSARTCGSGAGDLGDGALPLAASEPGPPTVAGMSVMEMEDHVVWTIASFGQGTDREFRQSFRSIARTVRRAHKPILLDLTGNLGGFRTRRHAVLSQLLDVHDWPQERERPWAATDAQWTDIPPMPAVRNRRPPLVGPVAVLVDGLSFSAALLLTDALLYAGRAAVFGCAPLGRSGGCTGSPGSHVLPESGWRVEIPTRETVLVGVNPGNFPLAGDRDCSAQGAQRDSALEWLRAQPAAH